MARHVLRRLRIRVVHIELITDHHRASCRTLLKLLIRPLKCPKVRWIDCIDVALTVSIHASLLAIFVLL